MVKINKKSILITLTIVLAIICSITIGGIFLYKSIINSPLISEEDVITIEVKSGEGFSALLDRLDDEGVLRNKLFVKIKLKIDKYSPNIITGTYKVDKDVNLETLIKILETKDITSNQVSVTIPEGFDIESMGDKFEKRGLFSKTDFIKAINEYPLPEYIKVDKLKKYNLEGYLYPDTYFLNKDAKPNEVITIMIKNLEEVLDQISKETGKTIKTEEIETLIIKASLVEKEVRLDEERAIVASVIENRLSKEMKMEFCSTVNYVIGYEGHEILTNSEIKIDSPFNTYKYAGLPIGPIASPGKESINAVLNPEKTDYLYFVLTEDNESQYFSKTLEEHEKAKTEAEAKRKALKENN